MKTKAFIFLLIFSFVAQIWGAQKIGILDHTIILKLPQVAGLSLKTNSNPSKVRNNYNSVVIKNSNIWLNYHSILNVLNPEPSKQIKAQITKGNIDSVQLFAISTSKDNGKGIGNIGTPAYAATNLNDLKAKTIIDNIGIAYTGNDVYQGHNITYTLFLKNKKNSSAVQRPKSEFTVTYTFLDN